MPPSLLRVAIVADLAEERWPSMDLVADMLTANLQAALSTDRLLHVEMLRPSLARTADDAWNPVRTMDRFVNRFRDYPKWLHRRAASFDVFHIVDHSYAHLVHVVPPQQTVVTCHDADAFLPLVDPDRTTSKLPRALTRRVLTGLQKAAWIACDSRATHDELRRYDLVPAERLSVVHNGVHPSFSAQAHPAADAAVRARLGESGAFIDLLHVGSCIPRKRIDLLLRIVAAIREVEPRVRVLKAGGVFTDDQRAMIRTLGLDSNIVQFPFLEPDHLAAVYRLAHVVLLTSDREGFGLPVLEALASGTPVVATDLQVCREVGGTAAAYSPLGDIPTWRDTVLDTIRQRADAESSGRQRAAGFAQAAKFSWATYAESMAHIYDTLAPAARPTKVMDLRPRPDSDDSRSREAR